MYQGSVSFIVRVLKISEFIRLPRRAASLGSVPSYEHANFVALFLSPNLRSSVNPLPSDLLSQYTP